MSGAIGRRDPGVTDDRSSFKLRAADRDARIRGQVYNP